jgi:hypothetical protein
MKECSLDRDNERQFGRTAIRRHGVSDMLIANDKSAAKDTQCLASAGYEENQADMRILQNVEKGVDAAIARTIRDDHGRIVEDMNEALRVPLG